MILVVGATGQLGTAVVRQLERQGRPVRALVRRSSDFAHLSSPGVELCPGDLRDAASLRAACDGISAVIATATVVFPRSSYSFEQDESVGYRNLLDACRERGVGQFLFTSILELPDRFSSRVPTLYFKRIIENLAIESGVPYTIFRAGPFMDDYFALMGSSIPLRGAEAATLRRPFWLSTLYLRLIGRLIEERGLAIVPGAVDMRHSFIALGDVASYLTGAIGHPAARNRVYDIGGPQALSWQDVAGLYGTVLGRSVRARALFPSWLLRTGMIALRPFSEAAANQLGILWALSENELVIEAEDAAGVFGVPLTSAGEFLEGKGLLVPRRQRGTEAPSPSV